jgi:hypothetical protein
VRPAAAALLQTCLFPGVEEEIVVFQAQRLVERTVRRSVAAGVPGAYYLKEVLPRGGIAESVGRDDRDLRARLLRLCSAERENVLFGWTVAASRPEAFRHECFLWHIKGGAFGRLRGCPHPTPPPGDPRTECPECRAAPFPE